MSSGLIILGAFFVLSWCWIAYEIWTAPLMPSDFDLKDEDIWPLDSNEEEYDSYVDRHSPGSWLKNQPKDKLNEE